MDTGLRRLVLLCAVVHEVVRGQNQHVNERDNSDCSRIHAACAAAVMSARPQSSACAALVRACAASVSACGGLSERVGGLSERAATSVSAAHASVRRRSGSVRADGRLTEADGVLTEAPH